MLTAPLRDRFGVVHRLDFYDVDAISRIVRRSAGVLGVEIDEDGVSEIAPRSRGTPRVANRLLRRVRDYAEVMGEGRITGQAAQRGPRPPGDRRPRPGRDRPQDPARARREVRGGAVGLETIAASITEEADTIMDVYEPYLLQLGFLDRTPSGRQATRRAYEHLGVPYPGAANANQRALFDG